MGRAGRAGLPADEAAELPAAINTPEIRVDVPEDHKLAIVAAVAAALEQDPAVTGVNRIDGVRATLEGGWGLVRASNTQAALVMRCDASTVREPCQSTTPLLRSVRG